MPHVLATSLTKPVVVGLASASCKSEQSDAFVRFTYWVRSIYCLQVPSGLQSKQNAFY